MEDKQEKDKIGRKKTKKSPAGEVHQRVTEVVELILRGLYRKNIIQYGSKWNVTSRTIDKYIGMANALLKKEAQKDFENNYAKVQRRYDYLYYNAIENEDFALASTINEKYSKLTGVNEPQKIEHSGEIKTITILEPDFED